MEDTNIVTPADTGDDRPPLWKQILGAVMGGGLALCLYYGYEYAKPAVTAYLTLPPVEGGRMYDLGAANIANNSLESDERKRIVSRNNRAAAFIEGSDVQVQKVEDHSLDIMWPEAEKVLAKKQGVPKTESGVMLAGVDAAAIADAGEPEAVEEEEESDDWESLWSEMKKEDADKKTTKKISHGDALPDSGFGAMIAIAGSAAGGAYMRVRRKKTA
ncbi:hypothetical protein FJZ28_02375 [Candidatus Peregrinibacteria bacterium]|nr:hypothetical protein [Candidatus Peregrinibacteria bacterium]